MGVPPRSASGAGPRVAPVGHVAADADLHAIALALDAPALIERGDAPEELWHVVPLAPWAIAEGWPGRAFLRLASGERRELQAGPSPGLSALGVLHAAVRAPPPERDVPFAGGLAVMLGYGLAREIERLPSSAEIRDAIPAMFAVACSAGLLLPVGGGEALLAWTPREEPGGFGLGEDDAIDWALRCDRVLREPARAASGREPWGEPAGPIVALWTRARHEAAVRALVEEERAGEIYQANLTQRFEAAWSGSALGLHRALRRINPSPFSGWIRDPAGAWELVSGSPERLVRRAGAELVTEPIAGTVPLPDGPATPPEEVARLATRLTSSEKDHAEHVMIVDLHRNDLGRVSRPGSVRVQRMMRLDRRSHVVQAVADIRGIAAEDAGPEAILRALFPGGCVTGVPKIRAMELLDAHEDAHRGPYTGSFGIVTGWGDLDLNVVIRSAWRSGSRLAFAAGGGIVLDSDPAAEHAESLAKAEAVRQAVESLRGARP